MEPLTIGAVAVVTKILAGLVPKDAARHVKQIAVMLISIVLTVAYVATLQPLDYTTLITALFNGIIGGAAAMGVHEVVKKDIQDEELG